MTSDLTPVETHLERVLAAVHPLETRVVGLQLAPGRCLARDVYAELPVPPWDNSAMDGYAIRSADLQPAKRGEPVTLTVVADLPAGTADDPPLGPGRAARIMTGSAVPTDADTVVQLEHTDRSDPHGALAQSVTIHRPPPPGRHIRRAGEDLVPGDLVAAAGTVITPTVLASLSATGHDRVPVHRAARVAVVATGSELVPPGQALQRGQVPDSNSLLVAGLVQHAGAELVSAEAVGDDPDELAARLEDLAPHVDAVILTGGVSAGAYDPLTRVFAESDEVTFTKVAMQPGKPQAFGTFRGALLFGLPGNPVSAWVSFHVFVLPALEVSHGVPHSAAVPEPVTAVALSGWSTPAGRRQYLPARIGVRRDRSGTVFTVAPAAPGGSSSHLVGSLAAANGYAIVAQQTERVETGDLIPVHLSGSLGRL